MQVNRMRRRFLNVKTSLIILAALIFFVFSAFIFADGGSFRPATKNEKDYYNAVLNTFVKAVPPGPAGWEPVNHEKPEKLNQVPEGTEKEPFSVDYSIAWDDTKRIEAGQAAVEQELAKLSETPNVSLEESMKRLKKLTPHDVSVIVRLSANRFWKDFYDNKFSQEPSIAGGQVYRTPSEDDPEKGWLEGTTYVFLGKNWKLIRDQNAMQALAIKGVPHTQVQTIVVEVQADQVRARKILEKIDWEALKRLIKN